MTRFSAWLRWGFLIWVCLSLWACGQAPVTSFEQAATALQQRVIPAIKPDLTPISDQVAARYAVDKVPDPLPRLEDFPVYGLDPNPNALTLEIFSSSEKANADKQNERWLVDVADAFNAQRLTSASGSLIQARIRKIPSGAATRLLVAQAARPQGFSPSNDLWVRMLKDQGVNPDPVQPRLVPNTAGWVISDAVYQQILKDGPVTFSSLLNRILAGGVRVGYPNPYTSSTSLNLLYSLFWQAAALPAGQSLSVADLQSPAVNSLFAAFQKQVLVTTTTTLDLQELFIRDASQLQAFPLEWQNFQNLNTLPGFETVHFVPFGIPHNNPLVGFDWNTPEEKQALQAFGEFAVSEAMQQVAAQQGFTPTDYLQRTDLPPIPSGSVLTAAQSYWKQRKDGGNTVYMTLVIDTSGSMSGERIQAVKEGLKLASQQINPGNWVGLVTFSSSVHYLVPLAPFDRLQHQRLLAAIDALTADGNTAMYDGMMVGLGDLVKRQQQDPQGRFYLLVLSDGETNRGMGFEDAKDILAFSQVRIYPLAYGEVNQKEMAAIAQLREATVKTGSPDTVQDLLREIFQTNL